MPHKKNILAFFTTANSAFAPTNNEAQNQQLTYAVTGKVDSLQNMIELDSLLDNNNKIKFLRGLNEVLVNYKNYVAHKTIKAYLLTDLLNAYRDALVQDVRNESIENIIAKYSYALDDILLKKA